MSAVISPCGTYRYRLERECAEVGNAGELLWVMLNPSTADASIYDPTIRKCVGFTRRLGFSRFMVGNLFGYRATDPKVLVQRINSLGIDAAVGPDNDCHIAAMLSEADAVVLAWGNNGGSFLTRVGAVRKMVNAAGKRTLSLGLCRNGQPKHPLMVGYDAVLKMVEVAR